jgi:uncharacterized protein YggE
MDTETNHLRTGRGVLGMILAGSLVAIAVSSVAIAGRGNGGAHNTISVTGSATVMGTPDTVTFQIGATTTSTSAVSALAQNNQKVKALEAALFKAGVLTKNMQTSDLSIYENTTNTGAFLNFGVNDTLNVTMHQLNAVGAAIDAAARVVGNGVTLGGISFSISNDSKLLQAARTKAMHNAYVEASQIARAGNSGLGSLVKVVDQENQNPVIFAPSAFTNAASSGVPVQAGSQAISVQVSAVYQLNG